MLAARVFPDGVGIEIDVPLKTMPSATSRGSLMLANTELEVLIGDTAAAFLFFYTHKTQPQNEQNLDSGLTLRWGDFYNSSAAGIAYAVEVDNWWAFGHAPATLALDPLLSALASLTFEIGDIGLALAPGPPLKWSDWRGKSIQQVLPPIALLDIRSTARPRSPSQKAGNAVNGGELYRSSPDAPAPYIVLDTGTFLAYFIPADRSDETMDQVVQCASATSIRLLPD